MDIRVDRARFRVATTYDAMKMIVNFAYRDAGRGPGIGDGIVLSVYIACCIQLEGQRMIMLSCQISRETLIHRANFETLLRKRGGIALKGTDPPLYPPRGAGESSIGIFVDSVVGNRRINAAKEVSLQIRNVEFQFLRVATPPILNSIKESGKHTSRVELPAVAQQPTVLVLPVAGGRRSGGQRRDLTSIGYDRSYRLRHDTLPESEHSEVVLSVRTI